MNPKFFTNYVEQVELLIETIPYVSSDKNFALKGGTAINLFLMDMPRLSVDLDLCYLPITPRDKALSDIDLFAKSVAAKLNNAGYSTREKRSLEGYDSTIYVKSKVAEVKIEINMVVRGAVFEPIVKHLAPSAVKQFNRNVEIQCLDTNDIFAGKICAALDRQHPRDFFDIYMFLKDYAYSRELHQTFMVYLLSGKRPISELIRPNYLNIKSVYDAKFKGMTAIEVTCEDLETTREQIFEITASFFNEQEKNFLMSFKRGEPAWDLFPYPHVKDLPAVQWKLHNIRAMSDSKRKFALSTLERKLWES